MYTQKFIICNKRR